MKYLVIPYYIPENSFLRPKIYTHNNTLLIVVFHSYFNIYYFF